MTKQFINMLNLSRQNNFQAVKPKFVYETLKDLFLKKNVEQLGKNGFVMKNKVGQTGFITKHTVGKDIHPAKAPVGKRVNPGNAQMLNLAGLKNFESNFNPLVRKWAPYNKQLTDFFGSSIVRHWHPHAQNRSIISSPPKHPLTRFQRWVYGGFFFSSMLAITYWGMLGVPCWAQQVAEATQPPEE